MRAFSPPDPALVLADVKVVRPRVAAGADGSTLNCGVSPGERFGRLSLEDFVETAFPGDGPGGPTPKKVSSRKDWSISTALRLRRIGPLPHDHFPRWEAIVLGIGIDWAEEFHVVALGRPDVGVIEIARVQHRPAAVAALVAKITRLEPDPAKVRVVIEPRHGLLVERLVEAGDVVVPVNPEVIARRRGPAKKKDDAEDARIACHLALDRFAPGNPLIPHGETAGEQQRHRPRR
jgi:hypothetical protein